jgi:hypothetical protein
MGGNASDVLARRVEIIAKNRRFSGLIDITSDKGWADVRDGSPMKWIVKTKSRLAEEGESGDRREAKKCRR